MQVASGVADHDFGHLINRTRVSFALFALHVALPVQLRPKLWHLLRSTQSTENSMVISGRLRGKQAGESNDQYQHFHSHDSLGFCQRNGLYVALVRFASLFLLGSSVAVACRRSPQQLPVVGLFILDMCM